MGPSINRLPGRRVSIAPQPTHRSPAPVANEQRYLEAA
jgi:hypothetical protein